jgi:hypothetical protein
VHLEHEEDWHWNAAGHRWPPNVLVEVFPPRCGEMSAGTARLAKPEMHSRVQGAARIALSERGKDILGFA